MPQFSPIRWKSFRHFLSEPLGRTLLGSEAKEMDKVVKKLFGYHLLMLGDLAFVEGLKSSPIFHRVWIHPNIIQTSDIIPLAARQDKLPIQSDEVDLVYLAHCLEFIRNPHEALREAYRVLRPEGHVIISCFNPWSLWGFWRWCTHYIKRQPWDGRFISWFRLKDWLALLGFDFLDLRFYNFRPPFQRESWLRNFKWMERIGRWCWPFWGGCYIVVAQKRVMTLTPIRETFKERRAGLAGGFVEPVTRTKCDEE